MAGYEVNVGADLLPGLLGGQDGLAKLVETVLNQVLQAQVSEALCAQPHERSEDRAGYRNGTRTRTLYTRVGPVTLRVPQTREGGFSTEIFARYQRSEQAFVLLPLGRPNRRLEFHTQHILETLIIWLRNCIMRSQPRSSRTSLGNWSPDRSWIAGFVFGASKQMS